MLNLSMPRQPRYFVPDIPQHVIQRGVDRQATFFEARDYQLYRRCLLNAANEYECSIHAYVLMTNHAHLLITPGTKRSLPLLMQAMGRTYVQKINRRYERTGTLWQGRYKACPVQYDRYLLTCYRYIELNPVRAGMVTLPGEYPYSSYAHNAVGKRDDLVTAHPTYLSLAETKERRHEAYRQLFADRIAPELLKLIRNRTNACLLLGDDCFSDQMAAALGRSVRPGKAGRPKRNKALPAAGP